MNRVRLLGRGSHAGKIYLQDERRTSFQLPVHSGLEVSWKEPEEKAMYPIDVKKEEYFIRDLTVEMESWTVGLPQGMRLLEALRESLDGLAGYKKFLKDEYLEGLYNDWEKRNA